jgi:hypothetical protein
MATNFADITATSERAARLSRSTFEHRFFLTVAILFPAITVLGFAPTYFFKTLYNTPPLPSLLVHAHGLVMSAWVLLFSVQACLISAKKIRLHMTLGMLSTALAAAMVVLGVATAIAAAERGAAPPGFTPHQFLIVPLGDVAIFGILFFAAIYYRKDTATHKRLLLVTVVMMLGPSIARIPSPLAEMLGPLYIFGVPSLIGLFLLAGDSYRNREVHTGFAIAMLGALLSIPLRLAISHTSAWEQFISLLLRGFLPW